jgi:glycosyltransferase involved in cell wall biosynthesis
MADKHNTTTSADVCLVLDGGYPHTIGGVSVWVDQLTKALPDVRFAIAHVGESRTPQAVAYRTPANVVEVVSLEVERERERVPSVVASELPDASVYHACITGHASDAAAAAAGARGVPLLVTEHGLAWREARWITGCTPHIGRVAAPGERERRARRLRRQARDAYSRAGAVTSVCSFNARAQRRLGAAAERSLVIPNCVPAARPAGERASGTALHVGFVGRVVPIKDVATLLRAVSVASASLADSLELTLVGPLDHDTAYVRRCRLLARELGIEQRVRFAGAGDPSQWYPRFDAVALTSASEAQPLALLEAMAAGVPVVATDVGGCRELIAGEAAGAGPAGLLAPAGDHVGVARALVSLARDPHLRAALGRRGRRRAELRHAPERVWGAYRTLYERAAA